MGSLDATFIGSQIVWLSVLECWVQTTDPF